MAARSARSAGRVISLGAAPALTVLVACAAFSRLALAFARETLRYFPDEHLYSQLARSLASDGTFSVLGEPARLPALLQPLLTASFWLPDDPELAFRATQALHAAAMSLAAVPAFLLARRVGLGHGCALAIAAVTVASPDLVYAGYVTADAVGYPLALTAVLLGVRALARPTAGTQAAFLAATALAASARIQYALLLPAAAAASLAVERWRVRTALGRLGLVHGATLAAVALASGGYAGRYAVGDLVTATGEAAGWLPPSATLLAFAAGGAVAPGATAWLAVRVARPGTRERTAAASLTAGVLLALLAASAAVAVGSLSGRFFERYLMIAIPLLALAFALWVEDSRPGRRLALVVGAVVVAVAARSPVSSFSAGQGRADSPLLQAVGTLEDALGVGTAGLVAALAGTLAVLAGAGQALLRRPRPLPVLVGTAAVLAAISAGAHVADVQLSQRVRDAYLPQRLDWVDAAGVRDVLLLQTAASDATRAMSQAFWNASVRRAALLGDDAVPLDGAARRVSLLDDGRLMLDGEPLVRPLLVATGGTLPLFQRAVTLARTKGFVLVRPSAPARLTALVEGLGEDGWLGAKGRAIVFPTRERSCRTLVLRLDLPPGAPPAGLQVGEPMRTVSVAPRRAVELVVASGERRPGVLPFAALAAHSRPQGGGRLVSVRAHVRIHDTGSGGRKGSSTGCR